MNINSTSTTTSTTTNNSSRVTGLATGMDTDAMVKQGVAGEQSKIDKVNQDVQYLKWQQEAYVDTIKDFKDFYNSFDILKADNMMLSATYAGITASSGNENIVTAKALPGAMKGNYEVKVNALAEGAKTQSAKLTDGAVGATGTTKLVDLGVSSGALEIKVNNKTFTVNVEVNTDADNNINEFINNLKNTKSGTDVLSSYVNISFSELTNKITIQTKGAGTDENLELVNVTDGSNLESLLGMAKGVPKSGIDADVSIKAPGEIAFVENIKKSSNSFTIDNISYNLVSKTVGDPTIITAKSDATAAVDKFKKFVEKYNTIVEKFNTKLNEKKEYTYKPLTDAQKASMKDTEITNWETAAKKGILRRDESITKVLSSMRSAMITAVEGAGISLTDVGITTTSNYMDGGKLKIDETKLKSALEEKGDLVQKLFTQIGTTDATRGIFQRIKETLNSVVGLTGTLIKKAGYTDSKYVSDNDLSKSIKDKNQRIKDLQTKMADKQQRLYSMYAALEKNMNNLNSQSTWLSSQLG